MDGVVVASVETAYRRLDTLRGVLQEAEVQAVEFAFPAIRRAAALHLRWAEVDALPPCTAQDLADILIRLGFHVNLVTRWNPLVTRVIVSWDPDPPSIPWGWLALWVGVVAVLATC